MASKNRTIGDHVGALLSGYIDGELTQQEGQRVELHCDACADCRQELGDLRALRDDVGNARLSEMGEDVWREKMDDTTVRVSRGIGWLLFIGGILIAAGMAIYEFIIDSSIEPWVKFLFAAIYGGLALLFLSVLRQRLLERKTDKYRDVEI
ncbi:MAG: zf-HC2 domain-containing protein [Gammaproteobacteria bacterium]|nr:zf-HC2 domain-containing protein [Gammaproteobacteria bacterium]MDH3431434.1 zf-HC2 domain-containing protein [Gammaproteobacteria bacterium]MDH3434552.1 zf-HC2 domain-containing protein [Gammaproteobacteria bacterium]